MSWREPSQFGARGFVSADNTRSKRASRTATPCLRDGFLATPAARGGLQPYVGQWPRVDIDETDTAYRVTAEIPGFTLCELSLAFIDNALVLSGEAGSSCRSDDEGPVGFYRTIPFDEEIDANRTEAIFADNVLTVILSKNARADEVSRIVPIVDGRNTQMETPSRTAQASSRAVRPIPWLDSAAA